MFTIKEVSEICGISRASLLRLEDEGFIMPYHINPQSGYRYYDVNNMAQIGQYKIIMSLGVSRKEAKDLYFLHPNAKQLLDEQKQKLFRLQRLLNEVEMRVDHSLDYTCSYVYLHEMTCYCTELDAVSADNSIEDMETLAYDIYQKAIKEGFHIDVSEPLFGLLSEDNDKHLTMCIPLTSSDTEGPSLKTFPACRAFSMVNHGNYFSPELIEKFHEKFSELNLKATGPERIVALIAPYAGEHFKPYDYCSEIVVPIETDDHFMY